MPLEMGQFVYNCLRCVSCVVTIAFGEENNQVSLVAIIIHSQVTRNGGMFPQI